MTLALTRRHASLTGEDEDNYVRIDSQHTHTHRQDRHAYVERTHHYSCNLTAAQTLSSGGFHGADSWRFPSIPDDPRHWSGEGLPVDSLSLAHQKWDSLCLLAVRQRALYTEMKNFSSTVAATSQDEPKALCPDDTSDKLQCFLNIQKRSLCHIDLLASCSN